MSFHGETDRTEEAGKNRTLPWLLSSLRPSLQKCAGAFGLWVHCGFVTMWSGWMHSHRAREKAKELKRLADGYRISTRVRFRTKTSQAKSWYRSSAAIINSTLRKFLSTTKPRRKKAWWFLTLFYPKTKSIVPDGKNQDLGSRVPVFALTVPVDSPKAEAMLPLKSLWFPRMQSNLLMNLNKHRFSIRFPEPCPMSRITQYKDV